jgi:hypothetical protein
MSQGRYVSGELVSTVYVVNMTSGGGSAVDSVFGRTGAVTAASGDYEVFYLKKDTDGQTQTISGNGLIVTDGPLTVTGDLTVGSDILPVVSGGSNLGSASLPFSSGYFSSGSVFIGDSHLTSTGNDLYVNGQVVYQSFETLSDFALQPASGTTPISRNTNNTQTNSVSSGNVGLGILSSQYTYWSFAPEGEGGGSVLDYLRNIASFPIDVDIQGNTFEVTEAVYQTGTGNGSSLRLRHPSFTNASQVGGTGTWSLALTASPTTPLADGDILQYVSADSKFKPVQGTGLRSVLGINEYVDDAAAGTGGLTTGELYYNTTSSSYVLKA